MKISKNTLLIVGAVASLVGSSALGAKLGYDRGEASGIEEGRYAMRQHIDNVRWVKMFNTWADAYDAVAADTLKKIAAGEPVSDADRAAALKEPKIDRQKTFGKIYTMAKNGAGKDPLEANWLKINGFSD